MEDIRNLAKTLKANIDTLKKKRFDEFMGGFNLIGSKLKETYQVRGLILGEQVNSKILP